MQNGATSSGVILSGFEIDPARPGQRGGMMPPSQKVKVWFENGQQVDVRVKNPPCDLRTLIGQRVVFLGLATSQSGYVSATGIDAGHGAAPSAPPAAPATAPWAAPVPQWQPPAAAPRAPEPAHESVTFGHMVRDYAVCLRIAAQLAQGVGVSTAEIPAMAATIFIQASRAHVRANITKGEAAIADAALGGRGNVPGIAVEPSCAGREPLPAPPDGYEGPVDDIPF